MKTKYLLTVTAGVAFLASVTMAENVSRVAAQDLTLVQENVQVSYTQLEASSSHGRGTGRGIGTGRGRGTGRGTGRVIGFSMTSLQQEALPAPQVALRN